MIWKSENGMDNNVYDKLKQYCASDAYPFHMPGHKRRLMPDMGNPYAIDITEINGFDNLHHAEGILQEAQEKAARLYGAEETHYLVNGSSGGLLAAVSACTTANGKLLMARNCHKAVWHCAQIRGLRTAYLMPGKPESGSYEESEKMESRAGGMCEASEKLESEAGVPHEAPKKAEEGRYAAHRTPEKTEDTENFWRARGINGAIDPADFWCVRGINGAINPADVEEALRSDHEIQAVLITSPTYDGIVSDVAAIAQTAHRYGVPLIVDEAHGAHFGFHPYFPENSVKLGADIVIHSLHKTLPSLTQTALLHVGGTLVDREKLREYLGIYQTSSPSYVFMAGMDWCVDLLEKEGARLFDTFAGRLRKFYEAAAGLERIRVMGAAGNLRKNAETEPGLLYGGRYPEKNGIYTKDPSKILLAAQGPSGLWIDRMLRERFSLELEMAAQGYALALTSVADTEEGFQRLIAALQELDREEESAQVLYVPGGIEDAEAAAYFNRVSEDREAAGRFEETEAARESRQVFTIAGAKEMPGKMVPLRESAGRISQEYCYLYPPGIPLLVPGERISEAILVQLLQYQKCGMELQGLCDHSGQNIRVLTQCF